MVFEATRTARLLTCCHPILGSAACSDFSLFVHLGDCR